MSSVSTPSRIAVGVMTGTSIDGIDASVVRLEGRALNIRATLLAHTSAPLGLLEPRLRAAADQHPLPASDFARLAWDFGLLHADLIASCLGSFTPLPSGEGARRTRPDEDLGVSAHCSSSTHYPLLPDLICCHGQTIFHQPPISWQLLNPAPIAHRFRCPVITDLRQADLAAAGQGAPITPIADWIFFRSPSASRAVINLGGFCNITILPRDQPLSSPASAPLCPLRAHVRGTIAGGVSEEGSSERGSSEGGVRGFDLCACNHLLNAVARYALHEPFDEGGAAALAGSPVPNIVSTLLRALQFQHQPGRSLGTHDELHHLIAPFLSTIAPNDLAASAVLALARCITDRLRTENADELIVSGGGGRNRALVNAIARLADRPVMLSSDLRIPLSARESACFAVLGALSIDRVPITLPHITGCSTPAPVAGVLTMPTSSPPPRCSPAAQSPGPSASPP